ncbi:AMP-binding protein [Kribbella sp. CA-294648]|uniref:AMP-binding protein n=1 Tax=Kribbella sp. CA-294648 TaxID=3239948 RepID=UPI003D8C14F0
MFERQVNLFPDAVALEFGDTRLSYREVDNHANRLSGLLSDLGVGREHVVAVLLARSDLLIVAELPVAKAAATFLPLDVSSPADRLQFFLSDADPACIIATSAGRPALGAAVPRQPPGIHFVGTKRDSHVEVSTTDPCWGRRGGRHGVHGQNRHVPDRIDVGSSACAHAVRTTIPADPVDSAAVSHGIVLAQIRTLCGPVSGRTGGISGTARTFHRRHRKAAAPRSS